MAERTVRTFRVEVRAGPALGATWADGAPRCAIGSHPSNDLVVEDDTVSRFHCELAVADGRVRVRDLGSRNGCVVAGVAIADATVAGGSVLELGHTRIAIHVDDEPRAIAASPRAAFGALVGDSAAIREAFAQLERAARSETIALIEGEPGTGKEDAAEAIHAASARATGPFVVVDCSAVAASALESELFGHEAGAVTGASTRRIGAFELASGGTLFLAEIGELPAELQPKLLRALDAREVRRVGGTLAVRSDPRVLAASSRDLRADVNRGAFRADLYYRLAAVRIVLPPLRERAGDVAVVVAHALRELGASGDLVAELTAPDAVAALAAAPWPGNVRELRDHVARRVRFGEPPGPRPAVAGVVDASLPYELARGQAIDRFEHDYVVALIARAEGNVAAAARDAGIDRTHLHRLLRRHGVR